MRARWGILALLALGVVSLGGARAEAQCAATCQGIAPGCNVVTCLGGPCFGTAGVDCIVGSALADNIFALGGDDCICGEGGDDIISAGAGADFVFGGDDNDNISGGDGADFIFGDAGADTLNGDGGADTIFGSTGDDTLNGGADNDTLWGEAGSDTLNGNDGDDQLNGGGGNDDLFGGTGADTLNGEAGADIFRGEAGNDTLNGGTENDQLFGGDDADSLSGGGGDDILNGEGGDDPQLDGGDGEDTINGGPGADTANGGPGTDFINGGAGNDTLNGGDDPDIINGGDGDDTISGDGGNDTLNGDAGANNQLFGNAGVDVCLNAANMDLSCELFTHATLESFAVIDDGGSLVVRWTTSSETGALGFHLYRERAGEWEPLHEGLLPGLMSSPQGGVYDFRDHEADLEATHRYLLVEVDLNGKESRHGPFEVAAESRGETLLEGDATFARAPHPTRPVGFATKSRSSEKQGDGDPVAIYVGVEATGLYAVSAAEIAARLGLDEQSVRDRIQSGDVLLTEDGETVAWQSAVDGSELFFFGVERKSLYTAERIYRLSLEEGAMMPSRSAVPGSITEGLTYEGALHLEQDAVAGVLVGKDPDDDYWFWQLVSASPSMPENAEVAFELEAVAGDGTLDVELHGITDLLHRLEVRLNGVVLGEVSFDGQVPHRATLPVPEAALVNGENTLTIAPIGLGDSQVYLNFADLRYTREYATTDASLRFNATEDASLEVVGLTGVGNEVFDVTDPRRPVRLTGTVQTPTGLQLATETGADYFAASLLEVRSPSSIWNDTASDLRNGDNGAEYLVIAPAAFLAGAEELADYRAAEGLVTRVVELQDIYDEFAFGTPDPNSIRAFLGYANDNWAIAPEYVVFLGKGSFDYRDIQGMGGNFFPPIMAHTQGGLLSSDTKFADFIDDDGFPDVSIGRLPVTTASELTAILEQIADYEARTDSLRNDLAMLADATTAEGNFGAWADEATSVLPLDWTVSAIYRSELGDLDSTRALLFDELRAGPRVFGYLGHAGITSLGKAETLFSIDDVETLTIDGAQPIFADMTCVASRFAVPGLVSLGEAMLLAEEGSIAVWGPSGLSINEQASPLLQGFLDELSSGAGTRIGPMIDRAFETITDFEQARDMIAIFHLFGDPALRVVEGGDAPGTGGSGGQGGMAGSGGTGGVPGTGGTPAPLPEPRLITAGCSAGPVDRGAVPAWLVGLGLLALVRRRRLAR